MTKMLCIVIKILLYFGQYLLHLGQNCVTSNSDQNNYIIILNWYMIRNYNRDLDGMELTLEQKAGKNQVLGAFPVCSYHYCRCSEVRRWQHNCIQHWGRWPRYSHNDCHHRWYSFSLQNSPWFFAPHIKCKFSKKSKDFFPRRSGCLASVQEEDKWWFEGGGAPR